jgi:predicted nucleic acid-binding protein
MVLLDSDVMIDLLRQSSPALAWLETLGDEEIVLPGFVVMELIQGCNNKTELARLKKALAPYTVVWPTPDVCDEALIVCSRFYLSHNLGIIDALIGQLAVSLDLPIQTFNQKHYAVIPNIKLSQPYVRS